MPEPWTPEWVAALDELARDDPDLVAAAADRRAVIGQTVRDGDTLHQWHLVLDHGTVAVRPGPAVDPDVTFTQDREVAEAIAAGDMPARTAFVLGRIQLGGDVAALMELAPALARVSDLFAPARTEAATGSDA